MLDASNQNTPCVCVREVIKGQILFLDLENYAHEYFACMCVCGSHVCLVPAEVRKKAMNLLEQELWMVIGSGN